MSNTPLTSPYQHPSVWTGAELQQTENWIFRLSEDDNDELQAALMVARDTGKEVIALTAQDFPLPTLAPRLKAMQEQLINGSGFSLIRGFDMQRYELHDAALIYWCMGAHVGKHGAQNAQGDLLGHVTDLGVNHLTNHNARGYQTRLHLRFHNDALDVVSLMCVNPAKSGGLSRIVSATAVHNAVLERRPDLLPLLYGDFYIDRRGEAPAGKTPYHASPMFYMLNGRLFCQYNRGYIESAQRFEEVPRLTSQQIEALDLMDELCNDPRMYLQMDFGPGDMQFVSNYTVLHSRTTYEDWPEPERRRYLLRLWLETGLVNELPPHLVERWGDVKLWQANPQAPIFDLSFVKQELAH